MLEWFLIVGSKFSSGISKADFMASASSERLLSKGTYEPLSSISEFEANIYPRQFNKIHIV